MNKRCFSFSLYGNNLYYYLMFIANIKIITENNEKNNFNYDIVIYTEESCKNILLKILKQENISTKYIKFKFLNPNVGSSGMMWRYYESTLDNYDIVYVHDIDTLIYKRVFFGIEQFSKLDDKSFMIFHMNNKSYQLCDGGNFGFKPKLFKDKEYFQKIINEWITHKDITYFSDEVLLNHLFKNYFKSNFLIVYSILQNKQFLEKEKIDFQNIEYLNEESQQFKNFKCVQISSMHSKTMLKYYDIKNNIYCLDNKNIKIDKSPIISNINYKNKYINTIRSLI